jgi:hypothetical protein
VDLDRIASRIAAEEPGTADESTEIKEEDINWTKLRTTQTKLQGLLKDLGVAIKNESASDTQRLFENLIEQLVIIAKGTRQREIVTRLKNITKGFKGED